MGIREQTLGGGAAGASAQAGQRSKTRSAVIVLAGVFLAGLAGQFFLAGAGAFGATSFEAHGGLGLLLLLLSLVIAITALAGRLPRRKTGVAWGLFAATFVQVFLGGLGEVNAWVASLHAVNALGVYSLAMLLLRRVRSPG